jgi:hypothetical protein
MIETVTTTSERKGLIIMKKLVIVLVFISLVSLLVTGCGQKATETPVTVNEETSDVSKEKETVSNNEETVAEEPSVEEVQEATEKAEETEEGGENKSTSKGVTDSNGTSESVSVSNGQGSVGYSTSNGSSNGSGTSGVSVGTNTSNSNTTPKEKKSEPVKQPEENKPKVEEPKAEEPKAEPTQPQDEKPKMDLKAMSKEELDNLLDSIYPGDSLTEEWQNRLPAEKMYAYFGEKYGSNFFNYIRTDAVVIDSTTVECTAIVKLGDGGEKTHKVRLKVDNNGFWNIISDVVQ